MFVISTIAKPQRKEQGQGVGSIPAMSGSVAPLAWRRGERECEDHSNVSPVNDTSRNHLSDAVQSPPDPNGEESVCFSFGLTRNGSMGRRSSSSGLKRPGD